MTFFYQCNTKKHMPSFGGRRRLTAAQRQRKPGKKNGRKDGKVT